MVYLMPGDPVAALGGDRGLTEAAAAQIRAEYHLDQPFWMQYLLYLKGVFTLDFGKSFNQQPVIDVMARAFPTTIALAIYALAIESIFGITLGVIAGVRRGGWFDSTILVFSLLLISVPTFVLGFVLQFLLGFKLGVLPVTASASVNMASLTMPAMVLGGVSLAYVIRLTRQSVSENVSADYVRTAREGIFNINGVGGTLWQAIRLGEAPTVVSITTVLVLVYILANLIVDLLYAVLDPRIRYE